MVSWLNALRRYVLFMAGANLIWEFAQLPLYTIWWEGTAEEIFVAALHCTAGDIVIATMSLIGGVILAGDQSWPQSRFQAVTWITVGAGLCYTIFSEWLNTEIRGSWAYTDAMPQLPVIGSGVAPLAQWLILPVLGLWWSVLNPGRGARPDQN